jgi:hypothetical protein
MEFKLWIQRNLRINMEYSILKGTKAKITPNGEMEINAFAKSP